MSGDTKIVNGNESGLFIQLLATVVQQMPRNLTDGFMKQLNGLPSEIGRRLVHAFTAILVAPRFKFVEDMKKHAGWRLCRDEKGPTELQVGELELVPFLKKGEEYVHGETLRSRAAQLKADQLGQRHAEALCGLNGPVPQLPAKWEEEQYILVFLGTWWEDNEHERKVVYLSGYNGVWQTSFVKLNIPNPYDASHFFDSRCRLVRVREHRLARREDYCPRCADGGFDEHNHCTVCSAFCLFDDKLVKLFCPDCNERLNYGNVGMKCPRCHKTFE
jgi:hypothetical protein